MTATATRTADVHLYHSGRFVGRAELAADDAAAYEAGTHRLCQWPEGVTGADVLLSEEQLEALALEGHETVYFEL